MKSPYAARFVAALAAFLAAGAVFGAVGVLSVPTAQSDTFAGSTVKVTEPDGGHGSGVHIGNRYIITAAHVVTDKKEVRIKAEHGGESNAAVLWSNADYDIALLRVADMYGVATSPLSCAEPDVGTPIVVRGNPFELEFVRTEGHIAAKGVAFSSWKRVIFVDATAGPGVSGGPVLNARNEVVAIVVGGPGRMLVRSLMVAVPASVVCTLLAKDVS